MAYDPLTPAADAAPAETLPIVVNPSSLPALIGTVVRILSILAAGFATIMTFLSAHDMAGLWVWLHTADGAGLVATALTAATFAWSLYTTWRKHGKLFNVSLLAKQDGAAPDAVLTIKGTG